MSRLPRLKLTRRTPQLGLWRRSLSWAAVLGACLAQYGCNPKCDTATPCQDALIVGMPADGAGTYQLALVLDGQAENCSVTLNADGGGSQECSSAQLDLGALDGGLWLIVFGTPADVSLTLEKEGAVIFEREFRPIYEELSEGSQGCVTCLREELDYTAETN